jgi:replication initiation protein RepC
MNGKACRNERHYSNSNTNDPSESEPAYEKNRGEIPSEPDMAAMPATYPLGLVLRACPDIVDYAVDGIGSWREFMAVAAQVRGYLGISPSAYADALEALGQESTAIVIACILQRAQDINSAGGYLRALTEKARAGEFSVGPMLMATLKTNSSPSRLAG